MNTEELKRWIEELLASNLEEMKANIYKLKLNQEYQGETILDMQKDIKNLYRRSDGWPVERLLDEECINDIDETQ